MSRIADRFKELAQQDRAAFVSFVTAGFPNREISARIVAGLPAAGVDIIELGVPFTDPMADGPSIQAAGLKALQEGQTLAGTLQMVAEFRKGDQTTPIILMGYYNPVYAYGVARFLEDATDAGVDGLIVVDLPPEEDAELCIPARAAGLDFIRLATPTTDDKRLPKVVQNTSGFVYYVSVAGITGAKSAQADAVSGAVARIRKASGLPVAVGFGVKTPEAAAEIARVADGVVVGSAIIDVIAKHVDQDGQATGDCVDATLDFVAALAAGVRGARD